MLDHTAIATAIGTSQPNTAELEPAELPEPLASVVDYLGDDLDDREFIPTAELLDVLPTAFGRQMGELGCHSECGPNPERRR